jgi:tol-pal system protein YbgF
MRHLLLIISRPVFWAASLVCLSGASHAALFEDEEARRAILELRTKVEQNARSDQAALGDLRNDAGQSRRSLLQLNNLIEQLRGELAHLRGQNEQLARDVAELQRRQKDALTAYDERLRQIEPLKVSLDGVDFMAEPAEKKQYEAALALFRQGNFPSAQSALTDFGRRYPQSGYTPWSLFWLANAQYAQKNYREALGHFQTVSVRHAEHPKAAEAMLSAANCQIELKDVRGARKTLEELRSRHPQSEAAGAAAERLKKLK